MAFGNTGYTLGRAKVMVSLPDEVLHAVDLEADRRGQSRSGLLRELAEEMLRRRSTARAERMAQIDAMTAAPVDRGGDVAGVLKASRPER